MTADDMAKQMEQLIKKHKLPSFTELDAEFEVGSIETPCPSLVRAIRQKVADRVSCGAKIVDELLYRPDNAYATAYEMREFTETDRKALFNLFKRLMLFDRRNVELSLELNEDKDLEFIKDALAAWPSIKDELLPYVQKIRKSWENEMHHKEDVTYFG